MFTQSADEIEGTVVFVKRDGSWKITIEFDDGRVVESDKEFKTEADADRALDQFVEEVGARQYKRN